MPIAAADLPDLLRAFGLDSGGRLSDAPVARGRLGAIWRLDTDACGTWAVKQVGDVGPDELAEITDGARFQEATAAAGVPAPAIRRTTAGALFADVAGIHVRLHAWVELCEPSTDLDPVALGGLVAALHRTPFEGSVGVHPWYGEPVGADRWRTTVQALRTARAPFADELAALVPELLALESLLGEPPRSLRTCHRDLWADNVRRTPDGGLCVFDFDNAGLADPSQELAGVLVEYAASDPARAREITGAYVDAGGPGRVRRRTDFSMPIAQLLHIVDEGCRRWLDTRSDDDRADNEGWVREFLDRPLTRDVIDALLAGAA